MSDRLVELAEDSARGGFSLFLGSASSTVILAVGSILVARLLNPGGYGVYSLALVAPSLLGSIIGLGVDYAVIRFPAKFKAENRHRGILEVLNTALTFRLIIGVAASLFCFMLSDFFAAYLLNRSEMGFYVRLASILVLSQTLFSLIYNAFIGLDRAERSALINALMSIVKASTSPVLIILGLGIAGAVMGHILGYIVAAVTGAFLLYLGPYRSIKSSAKELKEDGYGFLGNLRHMIGYSFPIYLSSILLLVASQYQLIVLAYYASNLEIGSFQAAVNLSTLLVVMVTPITTALFPAFSKLNPESENQELKRFLNLSVKYSSLLIVPTAVAVMVLSGEFVHVVYGAEYQLASAYLPTYISIFLLTGLGYRIIESFFNGVGQTKLTLKIYLASLAVFIPLAPLLTALYGVQGMIVALIASNLTLTVYGLALAQKKFSVNLGLQGQLRIYLSSALSALPTLTFLRLSPFASLPNLLAGATLYLITYITLTPILKVIDEQDLQNLKRIFIKVKVLKPIINLIISYESKLLATASGLSKP